MDKLQQINQILERGLYVNGLREMTRLCMESAVDSDYPLPYYVLASMFSDMLHKWDDRALYSYEIEDMEKRILNEIKSVINSMINRKEPQIIWENLNFLLHRFLQTES